MKTIDPNDLPRPMVVTPTTGELRPATEAEAAAYCAERAKERVYRMADGKIIAAPAGAPLPTDPPPG